MKLGLWMLIKGVELKPEGVDSKALTAAEEVYKAETLLKPAKIGFFSA